MIYKKRIILLIFLFLLVTQVYSSDFEIKQNVLLKYTGSEETVLIPENVEVIATNAFLGVDENENYIDNISKIKIVIIPNKVKKIKSKAFNQCQNITKIILPNNTADDDDIPIFECDSFYKLPNLVEFAKLKPENQGSVPSDGLLINRDSYGEFGTDIYLVPAKNTLRKPMSKKFYVHNNYMDYAFTECPYKYLEIGSGMDAPNIGKEAFKNSKMESILFNRRITLGDGAFKNCDNLESIKFERVKYQYGGGYDFKTTEIGKEAFKDCKKLREVFFHSYLMSDGRCLPEYIINDEAFRGCNLSYCYLPWNCKLGKNVFAYNPFIVVYTIDPTIYNQLKNENIHAVLIDTDYNTILH